MLVKLWSNEYKSARATAGAAKTKGTMETTGDQLSFAFADAINGDEYEAVYGAEKCGAPKAAVAIVANEKVYFDSGNNVITNVAAALPLAGICSHSAAIGDAEVTFEFNQTINA